MFDVVQTKVGRKMKRGQVDWKCKLEENYLHFCADRLDLKDWPAILNTVAENRGLSKIRIYSRARCRKIRERIKTEEKLAQLWRCGGKDATWPILYTNFLLRCLVDAVAVLARDSSVITSITLDGIPLSTKYLKILCSGLASNGNLRNLSLTKCRIGDTGCDLLLGSVRNNSSLCALNLSSCRLTNRSAMSLSIFLKARKADLLENAWKKSDLRSDGDREKGFQYQGLHTLILNNNSKFGNNGVRQLIYILKCDFWLKSLSLRSCGITKSGGETIVELLQTNSVLTDIVLTGNDIPDNILRVVARILKRRQEKGERISLRKRLPRLKNLPLRNAYERSGTRSKSKKRAVQNCRSRKIEKRKLRKLPKERRDIEYESDVQTINPLELESQLLNVINDNCKLMNELTKSKELLENEKRERLRAENECLKITPQLEDLKNKAIILGSLRSKVCGESQLLQGLQHVFKKLEDSSATKQLVNANVDNVIVSHRKTCLLSEVKKLQRIKISSPLQRRPYCPPLKI